ncbi:hypothetical protein [Winogradskyella sediminis]|uniref:Uncharacterized protein n=2 Tax=Winogradskyella sediminis TaxID=1382466 RepID=A0A1H1VEU4_9FLAO|nr:hypothetical protein [Winogradskyella sediminis]SDS82926.1 hypothetical protein SAMN04489797_2524 [Winogradskyella sediminis]
MKTTTNQFTLLVTFCILTFGLQSCNQKEETKEIEKEVFVASEK